MLTTYYEEKLHRSVELADVWKYSKSTLMTEIPHNTVAYMCRMQQTVL